MIRVSLAMVKQAQDRGIDTIASALRSGSRDSSASRAWLPPDDMPKVEYARRKANDLDAVLVMAPDTASRQLLDRLPEAERWHELQARSRPRSGTVRSTALTNRGQTQAVLGYIAKGSSPFDTLALAGRMLKEVAGRNPRRVGLAAVGEAAGALQALDALLAATLAHAFRLPDFRSSTRSEPPIDRIVLLESPPQSATRPRLDVPHAIAAARGNNLTRWLTALPPNLLDARGYRATIGALARRAGLEMKWIDERALRRAGANAFLAVSAANERADAGIAHLRYRPRGRSGAPDVALVGKGILFDTGGVNLKTHRSMLDMHTDMSGSAVALATLLALAELRAPIAADAWLAITENRIGPNAYRPQEVVRAANGVTIQVIHTDAEGRMVLADTLALAGRTRPRFILDFATLTGACVYALTERMSGVLTNQPALADTLFAAGRDSGERVWNFPSYADYDADLESKVADVLQCNVEGKGDQILAARFLSRFVPEGTSWAHIDLSSATRTGGLGHINTEVTGFGVRFALELLLRQNVLKKLERLS